MIGGSGAHCVWISFTLTLSKGKIMTRKHIAIITIVAFAAVAVTWQSSRLKKETAKSSKSFVNSKYLQSFTAPLPPTPTVNPSDPYIPMPLRVGTIGAAIYHRPFCPYAQKSLAIHGLEKRVNYWTREQVARNKRTADSYCVAGVFDCSKLEESEFAASGDDPWCGANIRNTNYVVDGVDAAIAGKTLCSLQGRVGVFVDDPEDCINGKIGFRVQSNWIRRVCHQSIPARFHVPPS